MLRARNFYLITYTINELATNQAFSLGLPMETVRVFFFIDT